LKTKGEIMKKTIILLTLLMLITISFAYTHVYSFQDFTGFEEGQQITGEFIPSNDDGTHGINDRWGDNNEFTWPDVPGDTNIYLEYDEPMGVDVLDGDHALHFNAKNGKKQIIGLKNVPIPVDMTLKIYYDFYINTKDKEDAAFVLFSSDLPNKEGRIAIIYEDGYLKGIRRTGRYSSTTDFQVKYDAYDKWRHIRLEIFYRKEFRIIINDRLVHTWKVSKAFEEIPFMYVGNYIDRDNISETDTYIKYFTISHYK
jgi:hypothetical protein